MIDWEGTDSYEPSDHELHELLTIMVEETGYNFRDYCKSMIRRRVKRLLKFGIPDVQQLLSASAGRKELLHRLANDFLIHVTGLFRDPDMYACLRKWIMAEAEAKPHFRVWVVGCSTGEEAFSIAMLLHESGALSKSRIYATDVSAAVLQEARLARFPASRYDLYAQQYRQSGGLDDLSGYVERREEYCYFRRGIADAITFSRHDVTKDGCFHEFDIVCCRNVMIYFNGELKKRVNRLLFQSLKPGGYLVLGDKESIRFTEFESEYARADASEKIYQRLVKGENDGHTIE